MNKEYLIGIDSGTQSVRVIVFDKAGNIVSRGSADHEPYFSQQPGWAEQHPEDFWAKLCQASQQAIKQLPVPKEALAAAGLAVQRASIIAADENGNPLRPCISWLDQRRAVGIEPIPNLPPMLNAFQYMSKANWMRVNEPKTYEKTHKFLSVGGWLAHKLTGEFNDSVAMQVGIWPFDMGKLAWHDNPVMYAVCGIPREKLADIYPPGTVLGHVTKAAAEETGLPEGLPIAAGAGDKMCETLGAGAIRPGQASITYGTLAGLDITTDAHVQAQGGEYWTFPSAVAGAWNPEFAVPRGYWMVTWFRDEFGWKEMEEAAKRGVSPEEVLNEQAARVPPGAEGLVLAPYWSPPSVAPLSKGVILGFEAHHTRAHVFRAILEGIAYGLRQGLDLFARDTGAPIEEVTIGGGGAQSDIAMQATADIFGIPTKRPHTVQICSLGAAMDAAVGAGLYGGFEDTVAHMTRSARVFEPIPENQTLYDAIYERVYKKLYPSLEEVYKNLKAITGR